MPGKFLGFEEISLDDLVTGKSNVRTQNLDKDIEDLAISIVAQGLLEPIVVFKNNSQKYEVLAGQRRFSAYHYLNEKYPGQGYDKIQCNIRIPPEDEYEAAAISLCENLTQLPMAIEDSVAACTKLWEVHGDEAIVQKKTGLSPTMIKKYVKFARLPPLLKDSVNTGGIHRDAKKAMNYALQAVDSLNYIKGGEVSEEKVLKLAELMGKKAQESHQAAMDVAATAAEDPSEEIDVIDQKSRSKKRHKRVLLFTDYQDNQLVKYADKDVKEPEQAAQDIVINHLANSMQDES